MLGWMIVKLHISGKSTANPIDMVARQLNDHAPVSLFVAKGARSPKQLRPIPSFVAKDPRFKWHTQKLFDAAELRHLETGTEIELAKDILRQAAANVKKEKGAQPVQDATPRLLLAHLGHLARIVTENDVDRALLLLQRSHLVQTHLCVDAGRVRVIDARSLGDKYDGIKAALDTSCAIAGVPCHKERQICNDESPQFAAAAVVTVRQDGGIGWWGGRGGHLHCQRSLGSIGLPDAAQSI